MSQTPSKSLLQLAWPLILSFWMRSLFNFVDAGFAATLGDAAVAAIGMTGALEFLFIACWVGTSNGLTSLLSQAMGARQGERIEQVLAATRRVVVVLIAFFMVVGAAVWLGADLLAREPFGLEPPVVEAFRTYASVLTVGTALTGFWSILPDSIVKAHQDTRATMWAGIASNVLNVTLNAIFLFWFGWGIFGIALSTVLGRFAGLVYALKVADRHERERKAAGEDVEPGLDPAPYRSLARLGVPAGLTFALMGLEGLVVTWLLGTGEDSTVSLAAFTVYSRWQMFFMMPIIATGVALLPHVARRYGARDFAGIRQGFWQGMGLGAAHSILLAWPVSVFLSRPLVAAFTDSPQAEDLAARAMLFVAPTCLIALPYSLCRPVFEGLQRGAPGLVIAALRFGLLTIPCAFIGAAWAVRRGWPELLGLIPGLMVAGAIASVVFLAWLLVYFRRCAAESAAPPETDG
ncbi:MAG: MATE family efflux transporter [Acidobacteriota bacterium]